MNTRETCPECGYTVRTTAKWLDMAGPPICPADRVVMVGPGDRAETEDQEDEDNE